MGIENCNSGHASYGKTIGKSQDCSFIEWWGGAIINKTAQWWKLGVGSIVAFHWLSSDSLIGWIVGGVVTFRLWLGLHKPGQGVVPRSAPPAGRSTPFLNEVSFIPLHRRKHPFGARRHGS